MDVQNSRLDDQRPLIAPSKLMKSQTFRGKLSILITYLWADLRKRQRSFRIGVFSIFLVVLFLSLLLSAVLLTGVIFLKLAESQTGEADLVITPISAQNDTRSLNTTSLNATSLQDSFRLLNFYDMNRSLVGLEHVAGLAPRWILLGNFYKPEDLTGLMTSCYLILAVSVTSGHKARKRHWVRQDI